MKTKKITSIIAIILIITTMVGSLSFSTSAATVSATSSFDCDSVVSFTVKTNKTGSASIKFTSTGKKESCTVNRAFFGKKSYTHTCKAPKMVIELTNKGSSTPKYYFVQDTFSVNGFKSISSTLKLDKKNTPYTVKVYLYRHPSNLCSINTSEAGLFHLGEMVSNNMYRNG